MQPLETERLILREFTAGDAPFLLELMNTPLYIKNIGDRGLKTLSDSEAFLREKLIPSYLENGYGLYAVVLKEEQQTVGMCGLVNREGLEHTDIGFGFLPDFMGQGYAYESALRVMDYATNELHLDPILAITIASNTSSIKLLNKLGLDYDKTILWGDEKEEVLLMSTAAKKA